MFLFCCLHPTVRTSLVDMFFYWKGDDFRVSLRVSGSEKSSWSASCGCPEVHRPMEIVVPRRGQLPCISPSPSPGTPPPSAAPAGVPRGKNEKFPCGANLNAKLRFSWLLMHFWLQGTKIRDTPQKLIRSSKWVPNWQLAGGVSGCVRALSWQRGSLRWFQMMVA